jgi:hypothetical protein
MITFSPSYGRLNRTGSFARPRQKSSTKSDLRVARMSLNTALTNVFAFDLGVHQKFRRRHCLAPSFGSSRRTLPR